MTQKCKAAMFITHWGLAVSASVMYSAFTRMWSGTAVNGIKTNWPAIKSCHFSPMTVMRQRKLRVIWTLQKRLGHETFLLAYSASFYNAVFPFFGQAVTYWYQSKHFNVIPILKKINWILTSLTPNFEVYVYVYLIQAQNYFSLSAHPYF